MNMSSTTGPTDQNESFEELYIDLQSLLNKCQYEDCCKTENKMSCKKCVPLARLVASISSNEVSKSLKDLSLEKIVQHVKVDETTSCKQIIFLLE